MQIKVTGKNVEIGDSLRDFSIQEVNNLVDKYVGSSIDASIIILKDNKLFKVEALLHLSKGFILKTDGSSDDPYKAVSLALGRLEDRIKKHKNRIQDQKRRANWEVAAISATGYVLERKESTTDEKDEEHLVIAEQERYILNFSISEAVMKLDLGDLPVVMFKNIDSGRINVVYKRTDGHVGWIDYQE